MMCISKKIQQVITPAEYLFTVPVHNSHQGQLGEGILNVVKWWVKERAVKKYASVIEQEDPSTSIDTISSFCSA